MLPFRISDFFPCFPAGDLFARSRRGVPLTLMVLLLIGTAPPSDAGEEHVLVETIDGTQWRGVWLGSPDGQTLGLRTEQEEKTFYWDEVASVIFRDTSAVTRVSFGDVSIGNPDDPKAQPNDTASVDGDDNGLVPRADAVAGEAPGAEDRDLPITVPAGVPEPVDAVDAIFHLADGGMLRGQLLLAEPNEDAVRARTALGHRVAIPFDRLAGVQLAKSEQLKRADRLFESELESRLPGKDVLITRDADQPKSLRGQVISLGADRSAFQFANRSRWIRTGYVYGIVFAEGVKGPVEHDFPLTVTLVDGSRFSGRLQRADARLMHLQTSVGADVEIPHAQLASLKFNSDRIVYVSDLTPSGRELEGILHHPWPVQFDRNVAGGPLSIDDRRFAKGIGMHSRTMLVYRLKREYETLAGIIGLDDAVRPRGHVEFRVLGDGRTLFASGPVSGRDHGQKMIVDVTGVRELKLVVDFGEAVDLSDHADWGDLRLITPHRRSRSGTY